MDIPAFSIKASAKATVNPDDPFAVGSYTIGNSSSNATISTVDQLFTIDATDVTGTASIDLQNGLQGGSTGGTIAGGDGKDPDGNSVNLSEIMAFHLRNTGLTVVKITGGSFVGADQMIIGEVEVHPGGEVLISAPTGSAFTNQEIDVYDPALGSCSFELMVVGKI